MPLTELVNDTGVAPQALRIRRPLLHDRLIYALTIGYYRYGWYQREPAFDGFDGIEQDYHRLATNRVYEYYNSTDNYKYPKVDEWYSQKTQDWYDLPDKYDEKESIANLLEKIDSKTELILWLNPTLFYWRPYAHLETGASNWEWEEYNTIKEYLKEDETENRLRYYLPYYEDDKVKIKEITYEEFERYSCTV